MSEISISSRPYAVIDGHFDEFAAPFGQPRAHWNPLVRSLEALGPEGLDKRWTEGRRLIAEHGITYNVYADPRSVDRPWPLDPIPLVVDSNDWARVESAVIQRATLLNRILSDIYGPRKLLCETMIPPELVLPHPGFLRASCQVPAPNGVYLHSYAVDLARAPNGDWWALSDRAQAPSGIGYVVENRMVLARTLPDVMEQSLVRPLTAFLAEYKQSLIDLTTTSNPRIVLLTPGPYNETYFEHALLARHLGISLVEGGDLTVRDARVWLKTLGGLLPVHVILRRLDCSFCDPLELRPDSILGVPGLVEVARRGSVALANFLGSGLVESAALPAFLPYLCQQLLGEELKMPSVATWWCGHAAPRRHVLANLRGLVLRPAFAGRSAAPIFTESMTNFELDQMRRKIEDSPGDYVAQEQVALSTAPVFTETGSLEARHAVLRVYAVASNGSYRVLPGGLTRVSSSRDTLVVSVQSGGGSKDTWVVGVNATETVPAAAQMPTVGVSRATIDLPSRIAENLFWLGRYTERVEGGYRLIRALLSRRGPNTSPPIWLAPVLDCGRALLEGLGYAYLSPEDKDAPISAQLLFGILAAGGEERGSLPWSVRQIDRLAWLLRDRLSNDAWRVLHRLTRQNWSIEGQLRFSHTLDMLDRGIMKLSGFAGLAMETMTRGPAWRFLDLGRRVERAMQVTKLLTHGFAQFPPDAGEAARLEFLVEVADSALTYRSRYLASWRADLAVDLLLVDEANPRSVAFQMVEIATHFENLPSTAAQERLRPESRAVLDCSTRLRLADLDELMKLDDRNRRAALQTFLLYLDDSLNRLSQQAASAYLTHAGVYRGSSNS